MSNHQWEIFSAIVRAAWARDEKIVDVLIDALIDSFRPVSASPLSDKGEK